MILEIYYFCLWGIRKSRRIIVGEIHLVSITKVAGIERDITLHMFRHSFATYLIEEEVDVTYVQKILGHSSIKTTQIYIHIAAKKQAEILREKHPRKRMHIVRIDRAA